jgi:hypothetical protein
LQQRVSIQLALFARQLLSTRCSPTWPKIDVEVRRDAADLLPRLQLLRQRDSVGVVVVAVDLVGIACPLQRTSRSAHSRQCSSHDR